MRRYPKLKRATMWKAIRSRTTIIWHARRHPWVLLQRLNRSPNGLDGSADYVSMCELLDVADHRGYRLVVAQLREARGRRWAVCFGVPRAVLQ